VGRLVRQIQFTRPFFVKGGNWAGYEIRPPWRPAFFPQISPFILQERRRWWKAPNGGMFLFRVERLFAQFELALRAASTLGRGSAAPEIGRLGGTINRILVFLLLPKRHLRWRSFPVGRAPDRACGRTVAKWEMAQLQANALIGCGGC